MEFLLLFAIVALFIALLVAKFEAPKAKGARGEARVNRVLAKHLDTETHTLIEDLTLPAKGRTTQIDHVVVGPNGIFVIETKNMAGWIFGSETQSSWTQVLHRKKSRFQNPLRQNFKHIKTIEALLEVDPDHINNLVVFVGSATPKTPMPDTVLWGARSVARYIAGKPSRVFEDDAVRAMIQTLQSARLEPGRDTDRAHVAQLKSNLDRRQNDMTACPRCGEALVARTSRKSQDTFMGCSAFPQCRGTRKLV